MRHIFFYSCLADTGVWIIPVMKTDVLEYYEYVLLYTDDALVIIVNGEYVHGEQIGKYFYLKEVSIGPPEINLDRRLCKVDLENCVKAQAFGSTQYARAAV